MIFDRILRRDFLGSLWATTAWLLGLRTKSVQLPAKFVSTPLDTPAISVPFGVLPTDVFIRGPRYKVMFTRICVPRFTGDVDLRQLRCFAPQQFRLINTRQASRRCILEEPT